MSLHLRFDLWLLAGLLLLLAVGLLVVYSAAEASSGLVYRQAVRYGVAVFVMLFISQIPPQVLRQWTPWFYLLAIIPLLLLLKLGEGRGADRWLDLGVLRFQPSELMKLAIPMMLAWLYHEQRLEKNWRILLLALIIMSVPVVLVVRQPDLGTAVLLAISGVCVIFLSGVRWRLILIAAALAAAAAPLAWQFLHDYQKNRILTFIDPQRDPLGTGWNVLQSMTAVGSGGLDGKGWLQGSQSHLEFLPEPHTDFILAVFAEEFGWFGVVLLFMLYIFIILRGLYLATQARDIYARLLAASLILIFCVYLLVNSAMVAGLLPVVGVPLPMVSYGGTSAVTLAAGFGMVFSAYAFRKM